jgi:6-phosphogluconolactonase
MRLSPVRAAGFAALAFAAASAAPSQTTAPPGDEYWVFFGTYTGGKGAVVSKGIYRSKLDAKSGKLSEPEVAAEMGSPSFVAVHPTGKFLYAVGEGGGKGGGPVVAFALDPKTGKLTKLNETTSGGAGPCFVGINPAGSHAAVANYGGGSSAFIRINPDGSLGKTELFTQHKGGSVDPGRQKEPHAHCARFTPDGKVCFVVDLGLDRAKAFTYDEAAKGYRETPAADITTPPGSGPRHIAIRREADFAYICGELDSTVNVAKLDTAGGNNKVVQTLSTLPAPVKGNSTAEVVLHPNGKFVYVSNRGHNSVAVFKVGDDKQLTAAGHITGDIKTPRNFNVEPGGKWMLIASQDGNQVGVWELDPTTGGGKETGTVVKVGRPVCVAFAAVGK